MIDSIPPPSSVFGGGASSPSPFGGTTGFSQTSPGMGFGQSVNPINAAASPTFGSGVAGVAASSPFGQTTPAFGQSTSLGSNSVFGNRTSAVGTASPFGSSLFGQSGGSSTSSGSPFAQGFGQSASKSAAAPLFGSSNLGGTGNVFGSSSQSAFSQPQASPMASFGSGQPTASFLNQASGFGIRADDGSMSMTGTQPQQQTGFGHPTSSLFGAKPDPSSNPSFKTFR